MYCRNCGEKHVNNEINFNEIISENENLKCNNCGKHMFDGDHYCHFCKTRTKSEDIVCHNCGYDLKVLLKQETIFELRKNKIIKKFLVIISILLFLITIFFIIKGIKSGSKYLFLNDIFMSVVTFIIFIYIQLRIKFHYNKKL